MWGTHNGIMVARCLSPKLANEYSTTLTLESRQETWGRWKCPTVLAVHGGVCCLAAKSCLTLCDPMDCSTPGFPVLHHPLVFAQTHVHWGSDAIQPTHPLFPTSPPALNLFQQGSLPVSWLFASGGQTIGVSTSTAVLPMNIHSWSPLGLTGLISLLSKGL